jgi:4-hydroxy-tetrahydrodipicolinate synthase
LSGHFRSVDEIHIGRGRHVKEVGRFGLDGITIFAQLPVFLGTPLPSQMIIDYHVASATAVDVPLIAFQYPLTMVNYPKGTVEEFSKIKNIVAMKEASFDVSKTSEAIEEAKSSSRRIGILAGSDTFILEAMLIGCDGALIGFAGAATAELVRMQKLAQQQRADDSYGIWNKLGPAGRFCWSAPRRDYRVRMKQFLVLQGVLPNAHVRGPTSSLSSKDSARLSELVKRHGLDDRRFLPEGASASGK